MKKILLSMVLLVGLANADSYDTGLEKWKNGDAAGAVDDWKIACNEGNVRACVNVATAYTKGLGVKQDEGRSKEFFSKACDAGDTDSCQKL